MRDFTEANLPTRHLQASRLDSSVFLFLNTHKKAVHITYKISQNTAENLQLQNPIFKVRSAISTVMGRSRRRIIQVLTKIPTANKTEVQAYFLIRPHIPKLSIQNNHRMARPGRPRKHDPLADKVRRQSTTRLLLLMLLTKSSP